MNTVVFSLPGAHGLGRSLAARLQCAAGEIEVHAFPDGEQLVRLPDLPRGCRVVLAAHLDHPDGKTLPLLFAADAARELGAVAVGLVVPYLPYMRQDTRFRPGEAITSRSYARLLSPALDFLVTVDPHLHRWQRLDAIYPIRTCVVPAAPAIAAWLLREVPDAILVGPDAESVQWVADVAGRMGAPHAVMAKERSGDREVRVQLPTTGRGDRQRTPVLLDDIVSTGRTLAAAAQALQGAGWVAPWAVAVHALLQPDDLAALRRAGVTRLASCNTVLHASNAIDVHGLLGDALAAMLA